MMENLISKHGGYRKLKSFQVSELVFDVTVRFCDRFINPRSRTHDQMVQAARSGVQNIAEGSMASGTSRKMEMKLTGVARASQEELRLDFRDFLRQHGLTEWASDDPRRADLIARRPQTANDVARWVKDQAERQLKRSRYARSSTKSTSSIPSISFLHAEIAANAALTLIAVSSSLLDRQLAAQAKAFVKEGGFTERLYETRRRARAVGPREIRDKNGRT